MSAGACGAARHGGARWVQVRVYVYVPHVMVEPGGCRWVCATDSYTLSLFLLYLGAERCKIAGSPARPLSSPAVASGAWQRPRAAPSGRRNPEPRQAGSCIPWRRPRPRTSRWRRGTSRPPSRPPKASHCPANRRSGQETALASREAWQPCFPGAWSSGFRAGCPLGYEQGSGLSCSARRDRGGSLMWWSARGVREGDISLNY